MSLLGGQYSTISLGLQTRKPEDIGNQHYRHLSLSCRATLNNLAAALRKKYAGRPGVQFRTESSAGYNCHGMVFASRRTCIASASEVRKILEQDGYQQLDRKSVLPGDIILYVSEGDVEHAGLIIDNSELVPIVLSKWGYGPEIIHPANVSEYDFSTPEYWRLAE